MGFPPAQPPAAVPHDPTAPAVEVRDLVKTYRSAFGPTVEALRGVSLRVEAGEVFGLLGPNGAGKTTLLKILLGAVGPTSGEARLFGKAASEPSARRVVGFLPEHHRFPDYLTAGQFLHLFGRMSGMTDADRKARIALLLDRLGMTKWEGHKLKTFSKGMLQRVGLAQALLSDPRLVFLDEPTDGVDPVGRRDIRDIVAWLRETGVTVFLNSHLLSEVEQVCTRVAILRAGQLQRIGSVAELTAVEATWEIVCTVLSRHLQQRLPAPLRPAAAGDAALSTPAPEGTARYHLVTDDRALLNASLDVLRAEDVEIVAIVPLRRSLEDSFIEVITGPKEAVPAA